MTVQYPPQQCKVPGCSTVFRAESRRIKYCPEHRGWQKAVEKPASRPQSCKCGCGRLTSGIPYREGGRWRFPEYIQHHAPTARTRGTGRKARRDKAAHPDSRRLIAEIEKWLRFRSHNWRWLASQSGVTRDALLRGYQVRPEAALRAGRVVGLSICDAMQLAGYPDPSGSPVDLAILGRLRDGHSRNQIRRDLGMGIHFVDEAVSGKKRYYSLATIDRLGPILGLSADQAEQERTRTNMARKAALDAARNARGKVVGPLEDLWTHHPDKMMKAVRVGGLRRRKPVDRHMLELVQEGRSYQAIARELQVSRKTVRRWARELGVQSRRARALKRVKCRRNLKDGPAKAGAMRHDDALRRIAGTCASHRASGHGPSRTSFRKDFGFRRSVIDAHMEVCPYH